MAQISLKSFRSNAILNIEKNVKFCFIWSMLASLHPCNNNHPNRVSSFEKYFKKSNIQGFDFTNGFKCNDVQNALNALNKLSINIFEIKFYQDQNK